MLSWFELPRSISRILRFLDYHYWKLSCKQQHLAVISWWMLVNDLLKRYASSALSLKLKKVWNFRYYTELNSLVRCVDIYVFQSLSFFSSYTRLECCSSNAVTVIWCWCPSHTFNDVIFLFTQIFIFIENFLKQNSSHHIFHIFETFVSLFTMLKHSDDNGIIKSIKEKFFLFPNVVVSSSSSSCLTFLLLTDSHKTCWHDTVAVVGPFIWCDNCWPNLNMFVCLELKTSTENDGFWMFRRRLFSEPKSHLLSGRSPLILVSNQCSLR